ncbi:electron transport complex subunit RsxG [Stutzerimonas tarimensis]|uniref:Ion-translocating oxidoreductase complex subunit G n=1 Tax=Stutzerimonas tarimensis TaxID=1507735 RepID=A0ABV7T572_9GAMM
MSEMSNPAEAAAEQPSEPRTSRFEQWRGRIEYQAMSLGLVCALVALLLLLGNQVTHERIAYERLQDRMAVMRQVLPDALYDNHPLEESLTLDDPELGRLEVYPARLDGMLTAIAFQVSTPGYGGAIDQLIAIDTEGRVLGVRVLSHKETPGLADRIEISRSDWMTGFDGLSLSNTPLNEWAVKKDGGRFDQFAGATITPRAVVRGVLQALQFQARQAEAISQEEVRP